MKTSRRTFIKSGAMAIAATTLLPDSVFAAKKKKKGIVGVQLYSVRDEMSKGSSRISHPGCQNGIQVC